MKKSIFLVIGMFFMASAFVVPQNAQAQDAYIGEIRMFAGNFPPRGFKFCDGQLLQIQSYQALFSILGTMYGGDGRTTFALLDLRGRVPIHAGTGPGLTPRYQGSRGGYEDTTLSVSNLPSHTHQARGSSETPDSVSPEGSVPATKIRTNLYHSGYADVNMGATAISNTGGNQPHNNMPPFLAIKFIIAYEGLYPPRD